MLRNRLFIIALVTISVTCGKVWAQGIIEEIINSDTKKKISPTPKVKKRKDPFGWRQAPNKTIFANEEWLQIVDNTAVDFRIDPDRGNPFVIKMLDPAKDTAKYRIQFSEKGDPAIYIEKGTIIPTLKEHKIVNNDGKKVEERSILEILGENLHAFMVSGSTTRASFTVHPDGTGRIYLAEGDTGTIKLRLVNKQSGPVPRMTKGTVVDFTQTGYIRLTGTELFGAALAQKKFVKQYGKDIWPKPFWQKPIFLGAFGAAVAVALIPETGGGNGKNNGNGKDLPGPPPLPDN